MVIAKPVTSDWSARASSVSPRYFARLLFDSISAAEIKAGPPTFWWFRKILRRTMSISVCSISGSSSAKYPYIANNIVEVALAVNETTTFYTLVPITQLARDFSIPRFLQYLSQTNHPSLRNRRGMNLHSSRYIKVSGRTRKKILGIVENIKAKGKKQINIFLLVREVGMCLLYGYMVAFLSRAYAWRGWQEWYQLRYRNIIGPISYQK